MNKKIKVFEAFAGYGSQSIALRNLGIAHEVVAISEIDEYAIKAYYALHDRNIPNLGDIRQIKVEDIPEHDLFTYSFPCTDISVAGRMEGIIEGETRSGLLYECRRIIAHCKPKYLLLENVKNLVGKRFKPQFDEWLSYLESLGYTSYWKILNAKDYGVPQNRERVFVVSILGKHKPYEFPSKKELTTNVFNFLEKNIDDKYYLSDNAIATIKKHEPKCDVNIMPTLTTELSHNWGKNATPRICKALGEYRRLTPREAFRFMGLNDFDIGKIQAAGISNTQQYKMAGNSIVVNVLEAIFKNLFMEG